MARQGPPGRLGVAQRVGRQLAAARDASGLTQEALAARLGCSARTVRRHEAGDRLPDVPTIERAAQVLQVPPGRIVGWEDHDG